MNNLNIITIDGPSAVGKSTIAKFLANYYNFKLLDSGAIYRIAALYCNNKHRKNINYIKNILNNQDINFKIENNIVKIFLSNKDVTKKIRNEKIGIIASKIASNKNIRNILIDKQRSFATEQGLVADGRDMGTIIFSKAKYKFFLNANINIRAKRRYNELKNNNKKIDFIKILENIKKRDFQDYNRKTAPLKPADDAKILDTSNLSIKDIFNIIIKYINI